MQSTSNKEGNRDEGKELPQVDDKTEMKEENIATEKESEEKLEESKKDKTLDIAVEDADVGSSEEVDKDSKNVHAIISLVLKNLKHQYSTLNVDQYSGSFLAMLYGSDQIGRNKHF